jgi:hypothetical protein
MSYRPEPCPHQAAANRDHISTCQVAPSFLTKDRQLTISHRTAPLPQITHSGPVYFRRPAPHSTPPEMNSDATPGNHKLREPKPAVNG